MDPVVVLFLLSIVFVVLALWLYVRSFSKLSSWLSDICGFAAVLCFIWACVLIVHGVLNSMQV